jgi:hypothetical protein
MFDHRCFELVEFENAPLNQDIYLMSDRWIDEFERSTVKMFEGGEYCPAGYIAYASIRTILPDAMELSWYPNIHDRFHEVGIVLPKHEFVTCIRCYEYDIKPHVFVHDTWLNKLYLRVNSTFLMVDAIGVKDEIRSGRLQREKLVQLRDAIDALAERYQSLTFVSFADSLLIKGNWSVGHVDSDVIYSYEPEIFVFIISELQKIYLEVLDLKIYAVVTQGVNEYYEDSPSQISSSGNHLSLNSLGLPFAQLQAIEQSARAAIKNKIHTPQELYMDEHFYRSLKFRYPFRKNEKPRAYYRNPMTGGESTYFYGSCQDFLGHLASK